MNSNLISSDIKTKTYILYLKFLNIINIKLWIKNKIKNNNKNIVIIFKKIK